MRDVPLVRDVGQSDQLRTPCAQASSTFAVRPGWLTKGECDETIPKPVDRPSRRMKTLSITRGCE